MKQRHSISRKLLDGVANGWIVGERIGKGSFGSVCKAQHYNRYGVFAGNFAIKVFLEEDRESGEREMEVIQKLIQCKNIVRFGKAIPYTGRDKLFIFSMELMDSDLDRYLREHGPLSWKDIRTFGGQLFEALRCLHERGLVHRDLKPANILISADGKRLKIGDLGSIARLRRTEKRLVTEQEYCTLNYRAPEHLFRSKTWTFKVDMWSAGCVVAAMMRPPELGPLFQGRTEADVRDAIIELLGMPSPEEADLFNNPPNFRSTPHPSDGLQSPKLSSLSAIKTHSRSKDSLIWKSLLKYDPSERMSAKQVLEEYFPGEYFA